MAPRRHSGRGCWTAVLELELPVAALTPSGRCTAQPPCEEWSALYQLSIVQLSSTTVTLQVHQAQAICV